MIGHLALGLLYLYLSSDCYSCFLMYMESRKKKKCHARHVLHHACQDPKTICHQVGVGSMRSSLFHLLFMVALWLNPPLFLSSLAMVLSRSSSPNTSYQVKDIQVILSFHVLKAVPKSSKALKKSVGKGKMETKTKELSFTFESSDENYLLFLSELLKVHGHTKYTPIKKHTRFGIKVLLGKRVCVSNLHFFY